MKVSQGGKVVKVSQGGNGVKVSQGGNGVKVSQGGNGVKVCAVLVVASCLSASRFYIYNVFDMLSVSGGHWSSVTLFPQDFNDCMATHQTVHGQALNLFWRRL